MSLSFTDYNNVSIGSYAAKQEKRDFLLSRLGNVNPDKFTLVPIPPQGNNDFYTDVQTGFAAYTLKRVAEDGRIDVVIGFRGTETQTTDGSGYAVKSGWLASTFYPQALIEAA